MKADMDKEGNIVLTPETNVEAHALRAWKEANFVEAGTMESPRRTFWRGRCLKVETEVPQPT